MPQWLPVIPANQLAKGVCQHFEVAGENIIIVATDTTLSCFQDVCSHQDIKLSEYGIVIDGTIQCNAHGARFDIADGKPCRFPGNVPLKQYPCRQNSNGIIEIEV